MFTQSPVYVGAVGYVNDTAQTYLSDGLGRLASNYIVNIHNGYEIEAQSQGDLCKATDLI